MLDTALKEALQQIESTEFYTHSLFPLEQLVTIKKQAIADGNITVANYAQWEIEALRTHPCSMFFRGRNKRTTEFVDTWSRAQMDYYRQRFGECKQLQAKCIYGDILLDCQGEGKVSEKFRVFIEQIPALIGLAKLALIQEEKSYICYINAITGAVEWSLKFGHSKSLETCLCEIGEFLTNTGTMHGYRWIMENVKAILEVANNARYKKLVDPIQRLVVDKVIAAKIFFQSTNNFLMLRQVLPLLRRVFVKFGADAETVRQVELELGKSYEDQAELETSFIVKAGLYQDAVSHYTSIGASEKATELLIKMKKAYQEAISTEMKSISVPVEKPEAIDQLINEYREMSDITEMLNRVQSDPNLLIDFEKLQKDVEADSPNHVLQLLMSTEVVTDGRVVSRAQNPEENQALMVERAFLFQLEYLSQIVFIEILRIMIDKGLSSETLLQQYREWDFWDEKREVFLANGFDKLIRGDYISALHILVPHFEACFREMFAAVGVSTIVLSNGIHQEQVFSEFLKRNEVKAAIPSQVLRYIEFVMVNQNGWNMRNDIAHGLVSRDHFSQAKAAVVLHLYLLLFSFQRKVTGESESQQ